MRKSVLRSNSMWNSPENKKKLINQTGIMLMKLNGYDFNSLIHQKHKYQILKIATLFSNALKFVCQ